jgi:hypothetical protein
VTHRLGAVAVAGAAAPGQGGQDGIGQRGAGELPIGVITAQ